MKTMTIDELNNNTKICLTALLGIFAAPDGYFYPCCVSSDSQKDRLLETKGGSLKKAFNSESMRKVRQQLANGDWPSACQACQTCEENNRKSHRQIFNESYLSREIAVINHTEDDGEVNYPITSLDIRWNNTCNFKCRMCNPTYSSAWEKDYQKLGLKYEPTYD